MHLLARWADHPKQTRQGLAMALVELDHVFALPHENWSMSLTREMNFARDWYFDQTSRFVDTKLQIEQKQNGWRHLVFWENWRAVRLHDALAAQAIETAKSIEKLEGNRLLEKLDQTNNSMSQLISLQSNSPLFVRRQYLTSTGAIAYPLQEKGVHRLARAILGLHLYRLDETKFPAEIAMLAGRAWSAEGVSLREANPVEVIQTDRQQGTASQRWHGFDSLDLKDPLTGSWIGYSPTGFSRVVANKENGVAADVPLLWLARLNATVIQDEGGRVGIRVNMDVLSDRGENRILVYLRQR